MDPHDKKGGLPICRQKGPSTVEIQCGEDKQACRCYAQPEELGSKRKDIKEVLIIELVRIEESG